MTRIRPVGPLLGATILLIGVADYVTGPSIGFSLFYLAPIVLAGWHVSIAWALTLAAVAACSWIAAEVAWNGVNAVSLWNGFTRAGIYVAMGWLTARVREDQRQLHALNARLQTLLEEEQQLARTDSLTGLANRRLFIDELRRAIARSRRLQAPLAIAYIDFDNFKQLNDRMGHVAGDDLLRKASRILAKDIRGNEVAARLGGDEFALLLETCDAPAARAGITRLFEQLSDAIGAGRMRTTVSVGVACFDSPPLEPEALIDQADAAMYCAKGKGGNQVYVVHFPGNAGDA